MNKKPAIVLKSIVEVMLDLKLPVSTRIAAAHKILDIAGYKK